MAIHGRVGDGGVAGGRGLTRIRCRRLCGVEEGDMTGVSDAGLYSGHPEEVCR
jgi:hypothetical protein